MAKPHLYIGIMSGTSLDGIDVALASFEHDDCQVVATHFLAYTPALKTTLLALHIPSENELERSILMGNELAILYAKAVNTLLANADIISSEIVAIGCHGQTIRHKPRIDNGIGYTVQIGNASLLAELTSISVVADFRSRDIAAGGQGAPLVPAFHQAIFASQNVNRAIVNIGGIANITYLAKTGQNKTCQDINDAQMLGFDSGPGNMLLDSWAKLKINLDYDKNGDWAATGVVMLPLLESMLAEPYFALPPPKSTGRDLFNDDWLKQHQLCAHMRPQDVARTLVELTAQSIANAIMRDCNDVEEIYVCGGGARNTLLMATLKEMMNGQKLATTDEFGILLGI